MHLSGYLHLCISIGLCLCIQASVRLTWEVEAAVAVAFGRGVGRRGGTGGIALLEGCGGGRCGGRGGGWVATRVQLVQHWRMILVGAEMDEDNTNQS